MQLTREIRIDNPRDSETRAYRVCFESWNIYGHKRLCDLSPERLAKLEDVVTEFTVRMHAWMSKLEREELP